MYDRTPAELTAERIGDAEAVYTNKTPDHGGNPGSVPGDSLYRNSRALPWSVTFQDNGTAAVAQFTMGLLLELCHHIGAHSESVKAGEWSACPDFLLLEISPDGAGGKDYGHHRLREHWPGGGGRLAHAFGMRVLANARTRRPELETDWCRYAELDELFAQSDVISLHCPLFPETEGADQPGQHPPR